MSLLDQWSAQYELAYMEWERTPRWRFIRRWAEKRVWKFCLRRMFVAVELETRR